MFKRLFFNIEFPYEKYLYQFYTTFCVNLIAIGYGIILGWPSSVLPILQSENTPLRFGPLNENEVSWISSILCIGGVFGTVTLGYVADGYGRKVAAYISAFPMIISWLLVALAQNPYYLYAARIFGGISGGGAFLIVPLYVSEVSDDKIRGLLGAVLLFSLNLGVVIGYIIGEYVNYFILAYSSIIIPIIFFFSFYRIPETPPFLYSQNKMKEAEESFKFYRGIKGDSKDQFEKFSKEMELSRCEESEKNSKFVLNDFCSLAARKALMISTVVMILIEGSGVYVLIVYTSTIFDSAGSSLSPNLSAIIVGILLCLGGFISIFLVEKVGRKLLLCLSSFTTGVCLAILGVYLYLKRIEYDVSPYGWIPIASLSCALFNASWGISTLPFVIVCEILPQKTRGVVTTFYLTLLWVIEFSLLKYFSFIVMQFEMYGCMFIFSGFCLFETIYIAIYMPETKGKSIDKIISMLGNQIELTKL